MLKMFKKLFHKSRKQCPCCQILVLIAIALVIRYILTHIDGFTGASEFVLYHMKGCPHCTKMMPEWSKFEANNQTGIKTRKVEKSENPSEVSKHGITGFPTILLLNGGNKVKAYNGPRTAQGFNAFCKQHS